MNSATDVWSHLLDILSNKLTTTAIETWFSDTTAVEISESRLVLYCPSSFKKEVIETRFLTPIKEALYELFSGELDLLVLGDDEIGSFRSPREKKTRISPEERIDLTFDRFVIGSNNKFAHAAAVAVSEKPAVAYNPLFIYGNSGLGKTHLLFAIAHAVRQQIDDMHIVYVKGEQFTNELIDAIQNNTTADFRLKYRAADMLLVDDIQFIAGRESTQEEFFHTFNDLHEANCQIVLTSDRPPKEILRLDERLKTRFEWGLLADIAPPDFETRTAIVKNKARQLALVIPDHLAHYIAENITLNVRQLEGTVKKLTAYRDLVNDTIDQGTVTRAIKDILKAQDNEVLPTAEVIIQKTSSFYGLTTEDIRGRGRTRDTALARQVSMYLIRKLTGISLTDIGKEYDGKSGKGMDHTTVINSIRKVEELLKTSAEFSDTIRDLSNTITEQG